MPNIRYFSDRFTSLCGVAVDIYRYFQPHHNPRLRNRSLRLQEIAELRTASEELEKAVRRAETRSNDRSEMSDSEFNFGEIAEALQFVSQRLSTLERLHPGDDKTSLLQLVEERKTSAGWENWSRLVLQRLRSADFELPEHDEAAVFEAEKKARA